MSDPSEKKAAAWQPLTFRGVAQFARASSRRLFLAQLAVAVTVVTVSVWTVFVAWIPVTEQAIDNARQGAEIRGGNLVWPGGQAERLAEGPFIEFIVSPGGERSIGQTADLQVEFAHAELRIRSLFGYLAFPYATTGTTPLGPEEAAATWGAWKGPSLMIFAAFAMIWLLITWSALAACYTAPALLFGFYVNRRMGFAERYRLCAASLLPAALFLAAAIALYSLRQLSLVGLLVAWLLHILLGWTYVIVATLQLPAEKTAARNPFARPGAAKGGI